jgi:hypothetical protein
MPLQQTLTGDDTEEDGNGHTKSSGADQSSSPSPRTNTISIECEAVDGWVSDLEEEGVNFAYSEITLKVREHLEGRDVSVARHSRVVTGNEDRGIGDLTGSVRSYSCGPRDEPLIDLARWRIDQLSSPESVRGISSSEIRVFAPGGAEDYLSIPDIWPASSVEDAIELINSIEDEPGVDEFDRLTAKYTTAKNRASHRGPIQNRIRGLENEIRARVGFSKRYGGSPPDTSPEYEDLDLVDLREQLETAREELAETEEEKERLSDELQSLRRERRARLAPEWFNVDE